LDWKLQVSAEARLNQIAVIVNEDLKDGASIEGVNFVNPFATKLPVSQLV
jgi:predicted nucleic acid-binding protein